MMVMNDAMVQINNGTSNPEKSSQDNTLILSDKYKDYLDGLAYGPKENLRHIKIYTAQDGDTLSLIANKTMGTEQSVKDLAELNGLPAQMQLLPGTKIKTIL
jgi:predicted Zn-dependent protease